MTEQQSSRFDTILAMLLGVGAIITAFAAYQASLKDGDTVKSFNEGIGALTDANFFFDRAQQRLNRDEAVFLEYAKAANDKPPNAVVAQFLYDDLMDENLQNAVDEWEETELSSPMESESYLLGLEENAEGEKAQKVAERKFADAQEIDDTGDRYELAGVIGAVALFFFGIAGVFSGSRMKVTAATIGAVVLVVSGVLLISA